MITLYQFPISHFCEKIRWALDFKNIDYKIVNMIPGLHIKHTKKMGDKSSVPIIEHEGKFIQGSTEIINYLDLTFSDKPLTPKDERLKKEVLHWENYLTIEVGVPVRLCVYHILLNYPKIVKPFFAHKGPWYGNLFLSFAFPKLVSKMRYYMKINAETAVESKQQLSKAIDRLAEHYQNNQFLVGDQFTRADLCAAALLAPLSMQSKYGLDWPKDIPKELTNLMNELNPKTEWVNQFYKNYR
jgi:glutathione S-transferase